MIAVLASAGDHMQLTIIGESVIWFPLFLTTVASIPDYGSWFGYVGLHA